MGYFGRNWQSLAIILGSFFIMGMSENVNLAYKMFKDLGYSDVATSALVGNAMTESFPQLRPTVINEDDADARGSSSFGIFQWRDSKGKGWDSPRIQWLKTYAKEKGLDPNDIRTQVLFADWELRNKFKSTYDKLMTSKNVNDATRLVDSSYLFSRQTAKNTKSRLENANQVLKNFANFNPDTELGTNENPVNLEEILVKNNTENLNVIPIKNNQENVNVPNINNILPLPNSMQEKLIKANYTGEDMAINNLGFSDSPETGTKQTLIDRFKNYASDPDNFGDLMGRIGSFANQLRLEPDEDYDRQRIEGRELKLQREQQNRTADVIEQMGYSELADMMRSNQITGGQALTFIKGKESVPSDLKTFRMLMESGNLPEGTTFADWKAKTLGTTSNFREQELFKIDVDRYKTYSEANANLGEQKIQLDLMESLLEDGIYSGGLSNLQLGASKLAESLGLSSNETQEIISNTENFKAYSNRVVLGIMGGSLGVGFSDGDRLFTQDQVPNMLTTKEGNAELIGYMKEAIKRKLVMKTEMENYIRGGTRKSWNGEMKDYSGGLNSFDLWAYNFAEDNPIFPEIDDID